MVSSVVSAQLFFFADLAAEAASKFSSAFRSQARFANAASTAFGRGVLAEDAELPPAPLVRSLLLLLLVRSLGPVAGALAGPTGTAAGWGGGLASAAGGFEGSSWDGFFAAFAASSVCFASLAASVACFAASSALCLASATLLSRTSAANSCILLMASVNPESTAWTLLASVWNSPSFARPMGPRRKWGHQKF